MIKRTVEHKKEIYGGKEYDLTITREIGVQEIEFCGEMITVGELVITESKLGTSRTFTRDPRGIWIGPEAKKRAIEVATQAMIDQGIW